MNKKLYINAIRNRVDGSIKFAAVTESIGDTINQIRSELHRNPDSALMMFADDYEFIYQEFSFDNELIEIIPLNSWKPAKDDK